MEEFLVKQITNLLHGDLIHLVDESKEEGFRFLGRLIDDYKKGTNTFKQPGEALYGVFNKMGIPVAIGGLNIDPFSNQPKVGRLRRFYVSRTYRRIGLGSLLLKRIILDAENYNIIVLHTDTEEADRFYRALGFSKDSTFPKSTHSLNLLK
jgi:GNAT superfamily N-acetyltransferase